MAFGASAQAIANVRSYEEAEAFLTAKGLDSRKICGNNTYVERRGEDIAVRLHQTDIITFLKAAAPLIVLDTGGWHSLITKQRLEQFLPAPLTVFSFKGQWRVGFNGQRWAQTKSDCGDSVVFTDGLRLIWNTVGWEPLNAITPEQEAKVDAAKRALDKAVRVYVKKLGAEALKWAVTLREQGSLSTAGDPWCCLGMVREGDVDHLWQHLRENYVFPTIILRAFEDSGHYADGRHTPQQYAVNAIAYGWWDRIESEVAKYLRKHLDPIKALTTDRRTGEPIAANATLERYAEHAKEALQEPDSYAYFGKDENLYKSSAPTIGRNRDSEYVDNANFEIIWEALVEEFPDLVKTDQDRNDENPGGIYVHGAGHWAVGWIEQIVVPVLADKTKPVGPTNLHPAFLRICEFAEAMKMYPALPGAEERAALAESEDEIKDVRSWLDYLASTHEWPLDWVNEHDVHGEIFRLGEEYAWDSDQISRAVMSLAEQAAHDENNGALSGQGVLL